jgi:hypothetical protein
VFLSVFSDSSQIVYTHCERKKKEKQTLCRDFISSGGEVKNGVKQHTKIKKKSPTIHSHHHHHHHRNINNNNTTNHQQQSPPPSSCWLQQQLRPCSGIFGLFMMELHENKNDTQILIAKERLKNVADRHNPMGCV